MAILKTARDRAREAVNHEILVEAQRQLAEHGAVALSLRSIARELGMVSSAIYRYVESRDELLTRLIIAAYDVLGEAVETDAAATATDSPAERWVSAAHAVRSWALDRPHEYALIYGSPVPGYLAPVTTTASGTRVSLALVRIVADAIGTERFRSPRRPGALVLTADLSADFSALRTAIEPTVGEVTMSDDTILDVLLAWTQMFGLLSFELFSQTRGAVTHHRDMFDAAARRMAGHIGLS